MYFHNTVKSDFVCANITDLITDPIYRYMQQAVCFLFNVVSYSVLSWIQFYIVIVSSRWYFPKASTVRGWKPTLTHEKLELTFTYRLKSIWKLT